MHTNNSNQELATYSDKEDFSLIELLVTLKSQLGHFFAIVSIGAILSVIFALSRPKIFEASIELSKPSEADIVALNINGMTQYEVDEIFKLFYDKSKSKDVFKSFIKENDLLQKIFPKVDNQKLVEEQEIYFALLFEKFEDTVITTKKKSVNMLNAGVNFSLSFRHKDEQLAVDLLNNYLQYVSTKLLEEAKLNERTLIDVEKRKTNISIEQSRQIIEQNRIYEIERLTEENNKQLEILQQERALLVEKAGNSRRTEIEIIEENNQIKLNELSQKRKLLIIKAKQDRQTQIAQAREAYKIANSLGIVLPTQLNELKNTDTNSSGTNINVNENKELALYLMGTKYLGTLIKTLEERDNDELHLASLNELDLQIETIKNDKRLEQLKARESDANFLEELNIIDQKISQVTNDKALKALVNRKSDDPYIQGLADLLAHLQRLDALSLDFSAVKLFSVIKPALVTGKAVKPSRVLIVLIGTVISVLFAIGFLLFRMLARKYENVASAS